MSVNLLDLLQGMLGKDLISQLGGVLGESTEKTQAALTSALPALVGGLVSKASSPTGAEELMQALENQDAGLLDNLPGLMSGQNLDSIMQKGSGLLELIFGGNVKSILDLLSKSFGLGGKSTSSLLSILAPIVISVLKQQQSAQGLDVGGLVKLLLGQKEFLRGKLPSGIGNMVGLAGLTDTALGGQGTDQAATRAGAPAVAQTTAAPQDSWPSRLLPLIALVALAVIAWQLFSKRPDAKSALDSMTEQSETAPRLTPGAGDMELQGPPRDTSFESPASDEQ